MSVERSSWQGFDVVKFKVKGPVHANIHKKAVYLRLIEILLPLYECVVDRTVTRHSTKTALRDHIPGRSFRCTDM
jgi:hypothetical protein